MSTLITATIPLACVVGSPPNPPPFFPSLLSPTSFEACYAGYNSATNWLCSIFSMLSLTWFLTSFDLVIFENIYGSVNFDADRLENLFFNPLLKTFLFAVDTSLFYSHKDPNQLIRVMSCELSKISEISPKQTTVKPRLTATLVIRSTRYYRQLFWPPGKNRHKFSCKKKNLVNMATPLIRPFIFGPSVTLLTGFQCIFFFDPSKNLLLLVLQLP